MFTFTFGAQKRFYRKTGDGSLKFVRRTVKLIGETPSDAGPRTRKPEDLSFRCLKPVTLRDDSQIDEHVFRSTDHRSLK
jgi:hypothetical protein